MDSPSFTAPDLGADGGDLIFELTITDGNGLKNKDTCTVSVAPTSQTGEVNAQEEIAENGKIESPLYISVSMDNSEGDYLTVKSSVLEVRGNASGAGLVVWESRLGDSGVSIGTSQWSVKNIMLKKSTNTITFTAFDAIGNSKSVSNTVYLDE